MLSFFMGHFRSSSILVLLVVVAIVVGAEEPTNAEKLVQEVINGENVTATVDGDRQNLETAELVGSALLGGLVGAGLGAAFGGSGYETSYYQGGNYPYTGSYPYPPGNPYYPGNYPYQPAHPGHPGQLGRPPYPDIYYPPPGPAYGDDIPFGSSYPGYYSELLTDNKPQLESATASVPVISGSGDGSPDTRSSASMKENNIFQSVRPFYYYQIAAPFKIEEDDSHPAIESHQLTSHTGHEEENQAAYPLIFDDYTMY